MKGSGIGRPGPSPFPDSLLPVEANGRPGQDPETALQETLRAIGPPVFWVLLAIAGGFAALLVCELKPVLDFAFESPERGASDQTFRLIIKPDLWGSRIRLRFSNTFGTQPVTFDDAFGFRRARAPSHRTLFAAGI